MTLRVNIEDMVGSAIHVSGQGEDLAIGHLTADNSMESALPGWQGTSATALSAKLTEWQPKSKVLLARVSDHAEGLHTAANTFASSEQERARALAKLAEQAQAVSGSS